MRFVALALTVLAGCFSESSDTPGDPCVAGAAGCDCTPAGSCNDGLECVASIDKCVEDNCTPGDRNCTCSDAGLCFATLECRGGVCLDAIPDTTGGVTVADSGETNAPETGTPTTSSPTTTVDPSTTVDSSATMTMGSSTSVTEGEDVSSGSSGAMTSSSETIELSCYACLNAAAEDACAMQHGLCVGTGGCAATSNCVLVQEDLLATCCAKVEVASEVWNDFVTCAQTQDCMGQCDWSCPP